MSKVETPSPEQVLTARTQAGLTQTQAGALVHATLTSWQRWEWGTRAMHPAMWELFLLKTGQAELQLIERVAAE
ncbi:hypothetical protein GCM10023144_01380 [Pigmentiphaga soli]|uniref:XRE family transcriptional regulator n=1 Tax=Pigmentiphaga soli TaxID=1007095 RepID=A0ABP8GCM6_9BURK